MTLWSATLAEGKVHTHCLPGARVLDVSVQIPAILKDDESVAASFIAPKQKLHCFTTIGQDELNKLITASKPTTYLLDPVPTKLLKELLPVAEEPLLNIINSSLSLGHVPKPFKLAVIKPLIKKLKLDPCELANCISNLPFMSKILGLVSIVMLMTLNYISQQDQMKLLNYLS